MQVFKPVIKVVGVGGGGNNALNNMIKAGLTDVEYIAINTDTQALKSCLAEKKIPIGTSLTGGLGTGNDPELGRLSCVECARQIEEALRGAHLVFVTAGKGGGTGTGAAPVIARIARSVNALTVGVVTRPFSFEGKRKWMQAQEGIDALSACADTVVVIPNDRLLDISPTVSVVEAFRLADGILKQAVVSITELIVHKGLINVDFAHVKSILCGAGKAMIGVGQASGEDRARCAASAAVDSPLIDCSLDGAKRVILNVSGGNDLTLYEVNEVAEVVAQTVDPEANIVFGAITDERLSGKIKVTMIASGFTRAASDRRVEVPQVGRNAGGAPPGPVDAPFFMGNRGPGECFDYSL